MPPFSHNHGQDIFLLAAGRLGVPIGECVVLEDAAQGKEAAARAGWCGVVCHGGVACVMLGGKGGNGGGAMLRG